MKIVIDIPEKEYLEIDHFLNGEKVKGGFNLFKALEIIKNGTPLPKGHGRLIDADEFEELFGEKCVGDCGACMPKRKTDGRGRWYDTCLLVDNAPTLIEADKAESEDKK